MVSAALPIASGVQGGNAPAPDYETLVIVLLIAAMTATCVGIALYLRRRQRRSRRVADQWQALAVMRELCPDGWRARLTVYGADAPLPAEAPASRLPPVGLEWTQFEGERGRIAVERSLWAPTIGEALQAMVEDRQTDIILEQIEQAVHDPTRPDD
jgi:hypothetical protein